MKQSTIVNWIIVIAAAAIISLGIAGIMRNRNEHEKAATWGQRLHNAAIFRHPQEDSLQKLQDSCTKRMEATKGMPSIRWGLKANDYGLQILTYMQQEVDSLHKLKY